ncbi:DUF481 domain-containing protein [Sulfurimonas sp.]
MKYLVLILLSIVNLYAIVSISPVDIGENPGFTGGVNGSFDTRRGNTESDNYTAGLKVSYDNNISYLMWGEFSFSYGEASGVKNTNNSYTHIRYIRRIKKSLEWEAFVQSQSNEFTNVDERLLAGGGLRVHINSARLGSLYFGLGFFYEYITYTTKIDTDEENIRGNTYIAYKKDITKDAKFSYVIYYQPLIKNFSDYVISNAAELNILIYKKLYVNFNLTYNKDSKPAIGIKQVDISQKTSFIYKF